ncbi:hypothetical protein AAMO2058_000153700 [Amorphochlora amoebiformis]
MRKESGKGVVFLVVRCNDVRKGWGTVCSKFQRSRVGNGCVRIEIAIMWVLEGEFDIFQCGWGKQVCVTSFRRGRVGKLISQSRLGARLICVLTNVLGL